ncbi:MAG: cytochrome c maturation protein CcmE domain-containing protein, partial [Ostreibacterium sp.]
PDLFREGQGVLARGQLLDKHTFVAEEILAKHDEKYMPKEVREELKKNGYYQQMGKTKTSVGYYRQTRKISNH